MEGESRVQVRVGIFVLAALVLFVLFVLTIGSRSQVFQATYPLRASFRTVEGLLVGAPVRLAGFTVGTVARIGFGRDPGDKRIVVDLAVDSRYQERIREDSVATISTIGLVGDKYVEVTVGSPDRKVLAAGGTLHSIDPWDYGKLLAKGDEIMTAMGKLAGAMEEFFAGAGSAETRRNLASIIAAVRRTFAEVEQGRGLLHALIYDPRGAEILANLGAAATTVARAGEAFGGVAGAAEAALGEARTLLGDVRQGQGLLHALIYGKADETLGRLGSALAALDDVARQVKEGEGLLHALIYGKADETLGRLGSALAALDDVARQVKEGEGLLHALIYDKEAARSLARLARAGQAVEDLARVAREGPGLLPALLSDPQGARLVGDLAEAAADLKRVTGRLARGEGTLGALLDDPTLYEDLSTLLRGAERSWILRSVIRSGLRQGDAGQ